MNWNTASKLNVQSGLTLLKSTRMLFILYWQQSPLSVTVISQEQPKMNFCLVCVLSLLVLLSFPFWLEPLALCFRVTNHSKVWLMQEWNNLIYGYSDLRSATQKSRFPINFIIPSKSSFKMLLSMISIWLLKSLIFTTSFQLKFKTRFQNLFSKRLKISFKIYS